MDGWTGMKRIPKYIMRRQLTIFNPLWSLTYPLRRLSGTHEITVIAVQPRHAPDVEAAVLKKAAPHRSGSAYGREAEPRSALGLA